LNPEFMVRVRARIWLKLKNETKEKKSLILGWPKLAPDYRLWLSIDKAVPRGSFAIGASQGDQGSML
jgi:hypothetical protein